ncbi:BLUF domain-containing protein [Paraglaciecola sp. 2405UD69-4]|uniref:BLUF domain-containing protein n=1 Tax=Paraglaciecola sp. 2405UD69-4 TaxID=3391836 RepID=UPI0039C9F8B9
MFQLVYLSDKTNSIEKSDIENILSSSRVNNKSKDITGLLLHLPEHFIQILEGGQKQVEKVFEKICKDDRHTNVRLIFSEHAMQRDFGKWSMGFSENLKASEIQDTIHIINALSNTQRFNEMQANSLRLLLKSLA